MNRFLAFMACFAAIFQAVGSVKADIPYIEIYAQEPQPWRDSIVTGQRQPDWEERFADLIAAEGDDSEVEWEDIHDVLADMAGRPIDINAATREDFEQLPFLTERQVEELCEYLYRYGRMRTVNELRLIESLDYGRRRLLECFLYAGPGPAESRPSFRDMLSRGHSTLMATAKIPFYDRKGDRDGYLGYKYKHWLRYDYAYSDRLRFGLVASQDAGEPMFASGNSMGYDYYSFYFQLKHVGRVDNLTVGRYRLAFGQGLVLGSSFNLGKTVMLSSMGRPVSAIRVHSSRSEADYFQGAAATIGLTHRIRLSAFASHRFLDATLNSDGTAATLITSGYHRTVKEMEKKNNTRSTAAGADISYSTGALNLGITAVYTRLDRLLAPDTSKAYRRYYPAGTSFANLGLHYAYRHHLFSFNGETATDRHGAIATINSLSANLSDRLTLMLLHRFYSHRYTSLYAGSFSDGSRVQNENGLCLSLSWQPVHRLTLTAYTDWSRSFWPKYLISFTSHSSDNMLSVTYTTRRWAFGSRYRLRLRQRDNARKTALIAYNDHRLRLYATYATADNCWTFRTQTDLSLTEYRERDRGWMVTENITCRFPWLRLSLDANYFRTDSYYSRLYAYEHGLLNSFSFPPFSGHGMRCAAIARADFGHRLMLMLKLGVTNYFDRNTIGSSYQTINASSAVDLELQARVRW